MQVYRARMAGSSPFPLSYYLDNKAPIAPPGALPPTSDVAAVDPEKTKLQGFTFFECVKVEQGFPVLASFLLCGVDPNAAMRDNIGASALHIAAAGGNVLAINFLLDNGASVDARTRNGQTPLMWAMRKNQTAVASLLLRRSADPNATDNEGLGLMSFSTESPLTLHFLAQHMDVAAAAAKEKLLHTLCKTRGTRYSVLYCVEQLGISVNERDIGGRTALHHAALSGDIDVVKALAMKGADLAAVDERGMRADTQSGVSNEIKTFLTRFENETNKTIRERLAIPDFTNLARLNLTQVKHFAVAFIVPNLIVYIGSHFPVWIGFVALFCCAVGFTMVAQFGMGQKGRSMATAGWFLGALCFGGGVVARQTLPSYAEEHPETLVPAAWWIVTVLMFYCYVRAVLADPGVVHSTAEGRKAIFEVAAAGGDAELQSQGFDLTSMVKKPLRAKHCSKTGQCVYRFDHYCVWTGNAIGGGNHRFFVLYCLFQFFSQTLVAFTTYQYLVNDAPRRANVSSIFSSEYASLIFNKDNILVVFLLVMYNSFVFLFVSTVLVSQFWYATRNVTSNEVWFADRYKWMFVLQKRAYCLYDNGWKSNLMEFFWSGNLCAELHTIPPMNDYLKGVCAKHAAKLRNQQLHEQNMIQKEQQQVGQLQSSSSLGGAPTSGGFDYAAAVAQLPENVQFEMQVVQGMVQRMISEGSTEGVEVPSEVAEDRRDALLLQAKTMFQHFNMTLQRNRASAAAATEERVTLLPEADERAEVAGSVAVEIPHSSPVAANAPVKRTGGRKAE
jgi:ankyrin repeat protein